MIERGVVNRGVDRREACRANRERLENTEGLFPRALDGSLCLGGMLEHNRHAAPTVQFLLEYFGARAVDVLPRAGIRLVVHARYDDADHPPDEDTYCAGIGSSAARTGIFICSIGQVRVSMGITTTLSCVLLFCHALLPLRTRAMKVIGLSTMLTLRCCAVVF